MDRLRALPIPSELASQDRQFDYVIVGGGSAGCALAARLSEDPSLSVCLIEAGGSGRSVLIDTPILLAVTVPRRIHNWALETAPQAGLAGRRGYQPRGKALGGSSAINAMVYMRGHPRDYDDWAAAGNPRLGLARRAAVVQAQRTQRTRRGRLPRHGRSAERRGPALAACRVARVRRSGGAGRPSAQRGFQRRNPGRRRPVPGDAEERPALERGARLPRRRGGPRQSDGGQPARTRCGCCSMARPATASKRREARFARGAKPSSPAARSARRSCCCSRASGRATNSPATASRCATNCRASAATCRTTPTT